MAKFKIFYDITESRTVLKEVEAENIDEAKEKVADEADNRFNETDGWHTVNSDSYEEYREDLTEGK